MISFFGKLKNLLRHKLYSLISDNHVSTSDNGIKVAGDQETWHILQVTKQILKPSAKLKNSE